MSEQIKEVLGSLEKANVKHIFKKGRKENWENHRVVSLFLSLGRGWDASSCSHFPGSRRTRKGLLSQNGQEKDRHDVYWEFCKASDMVSL